MDRIQAMRLLLRLAERQSFSAAARDLQIKQSTASKWVASLEEELGAALVERTTRSLRFTGAGRRFLSRATEVVAAYDDIAVELREESAELSGRVRLSVPSVFGRRFVVPSLTTFLRQHARVEAELILDDRYVNLVEEGIDVAIRVGVPSDTSARGRKLAESRRHLVASKAYLKARGRPKMPKDLERHDCLVHGVGSPSAIWRFAARSGRPRGAEVPVGVRGRASASSSEAVLHMARAGLGIALLADWLVEDELRRGRLVSLLPEYQAPPAPVYALTPPGRYTTVLVRALVEHLATTLAR